MSQGGLEGPGDSDAHFAVRASGSSPSLLTHRCRPCGRKTSQVTWWLRGVNEGAPVLAPGEPGLGVSPRRDWGPQTVS